MKSTGAFYEKLLDWLIPCLLAGTIYTLNRIRDELASMGSTLAVAVSKVDDHERRIENLEGNRDESQGGLPNVRRGPIQRPHQNDP